MTGQNPELRMGGREWALLLILSILWGGSFFFCKVLVDHVPPLTVVLGRVGIAAVALNAWLAVRRDPMTLTPRLWGAFFVMGFINNVVPFTLIAFGETRVSSGLASILNATTPIFTVLAAHALTDNERLTSVKAVGVGFGFLGVSVLVGPGLLSGLGKDVIGEAACLLAAVVYALAGIYGRRFRDLPPLKVATGQVTSSTAILIPLSVVVDRPWTLPALEPAVWAAWLGIALLSTALAFIIYFRILAVAGATNLLLVTFLLPISALLLGAVFLNEHISFRSIGGMAMIGVGLAAIDGRLWRLAKRAGSAIKLAGAGARKT